MKVKWTTKKNLFPKMQQAAAKLNGRKVQIGVFGERAWLAGVHEYGCDIVPKQAKYLTVPCSPNSYGKRARDFKNLFFLQSDSGEKFLARPVGKNRFEVLFWLAKKVHIPERAFLRNGYDDGKEEVIKDAESIFSQVLTGDLSVEHLLAQIGREMAGHIQTFARNLNDPPNHWATVEAKGSSNPLNDTGGMIDSISYEVK